jgi:hypothetical protein
VRITCITIRQTLREIRPGSTRLKTAPRWITSFVLILLISVGGFAVPIQAHAANTCPSIFNSSDERPPYEHYWTSVRRLHEKTPKDVRQNMAHPIFTESAKDVLELASETLAEKLNDQRDPAKKAFLIDYVKRLRQLTKENVEANGDVTHNWALELGYHTAILQNMLLGIKPINLGLPNGLDTQLPTVRPGLNTHIRGLMAHALLVPTTRDLSERDLVIARANGVHYVGVVKKIVLDGSPRDPVNFYEHDLGHAMSAVSALNMFVRSFPQYRQQVGHPPPDVDLINTPEGKLFRRVLLSLVQSMDSLSVAENKRAGILMLFMFAHEQEAAAVHIATGNTPLDVGLNKMGDQLVPRLADRKDFGQAYPDLAGIEDGQLDRRIAFVKTGVAVLREALLRQPLNLRIEPLKP